jgi:mannose-1-phosphate guanylyltransferase
LRFPGLPLAAIQGMQVRGSETTRSRRRRGAGGRLWAIVLAGGEGSRLAPLTRAVYGWDLPKQFAALGDERSFLQQTMDRIAPLVPLARTVVVVSQGHARLAETQLGGYPGTRLVLQPANTGTTAGVLLPLAHILAADPTALVTIFPCDHRFRRPTAFLTAVRRAVSAARDSRGGIVLIGATPESALADLGWIVPGRAPAGRHALGVKCFVEKPRQERIWELLHQGGLWNTMVIAARGRALWKAVHRHVPAVAGPLGRYAETIGTPRAEEVLGQVYLRLPSSDLSEDVLQVARGLEVVPMVDSGWSDCGTPERLFRSLDRAESDRLRQACRRRSVGGLDGSRRWRVPAAVLRVDASEGR